MTIIQYAIVLFVAFVLLKVVQQYRRKRISIMSLFLWLGFWILVGVAVVLPKTTDLIASYVGVGRGADLLVYISIIALFYAVFRLLVKFHRWQGEFTELVRTLAQLHVVDNSQKTTNVEKK